MLSGARVVLAGVACVARFLEMLGNQGMQRVGALGAAQVHQPGGNFGVAFLARPLEHRRVGDLVQQVVFEAELGGLVDRARGVRHDHLEPLQAGQCDRCLCIEGRERSVPENIADQCRLLQARAIRRGQAVQACLQHAGQSGRNARGTQLLGLHAPRIPTRHDRAFVDQHLQQLFHVIRVARGPCREQLAQGLRYLVQALQQLAGQFKTVRAVQGLELDARVPRRLRGPVRPPLEQGRSRGGDEQRRHVAIQLGQLFEEAQRGLVGPMHVVQQYQHLRGFALGHAAHRLCGDVKAARTQLRSVVGNAGHVAAGSQVQPREMAQHMGIADSDVGAEFGFEKRPDSRLELVLGGGQIVAVGDLEAPGEHVAQQTIGPCLGARLSPATEDEVGRRPRLGPVFEFVEQATLAQAGLASTR